MSFTRNGFTLLWDSPDLYGSSLFTYRPRHNAADTPPVTAYVVEYRVEDTTTTTTTTTSTTTTTTSSSSSSDQQWKRYARLTDNRCTLLGLPPSKSLVARVAAENQAGIGEYVYTEIIDTTYYG